MDGRSGGECTGLLVGGSGCSPLLGGLAAVVADLLATVHWGENFRIKTFSVFIEHFKIRLDRTSIV